MKRLAALLLLAALPGCGTYVNCLNLGGTRPYGGVLIDGGLIACAVHQGELIPLSGIVFLDVPFSLVGDTVTLPYTLTCRPNGVNWR